MTTLDQYIRHARLFGTECVYETAGQEGHGPRTLARLRIELDAIEAARRSRRGFTVGKRRRRSAEATRLAVEALSVEGLGRKAIADKLGLSDYTVPQHLRALRATEKPLREAA